MLTRGLWGVLATPFHGPDLAVDLDSLRREVDLFAGVPADGLVVLGVFGEGASLSLTEQASVVTTVAQQAGGLPLVVGVSARSTAPAVEQARNAIDAAGSAGVALAGAMVQVNSADPVVVARHLAAVHEATGVGVVVQDYPEASGVRISPADLVTAVKECPFVVAVKAEAPPTVVAIAAMATETEVPVFGGLGGLNLLDELAAGSAGAMTGFSHPEGLRAAIVAFRDGGYAAARAAFAPWLPLVNYEAQPRVGLALRKEILRRRGVFTEASVRPPAQPAPEPLLQLLATHLSAVRPTSGR